MSNLGLKRVLVSELRCVGSEDPEYLCEIINRIWGKKYKVLEVEDELLCIKSEEMDFQPPNPDDYFSGF